MNTKLVVILNLSAQVRIVLVRLMRKASYIIFVVCVDNYY